MHLAIVSPYPPNITGIGQYGYHVSRLLAQSGVFERITILTGEPMAAHPVVTIPPIEIKYAWHPESIVSGWRVAASLKQIRPDVVWFNLGVSVFGRSPLANLSGFLSPFLVQRMGFPSILTLHELIELVDLRALKSPGGFLAPYGARLLTRMALQADVICLTMRYYLDWMSEHHNHKQYVHIPIGAYYQPEMLHENSSRELLFFSTLAPFKGVEVLLQAFRALQRDYPDLRLTIAGADHARFPGYSQALRQTFGVLDGIRWLGQVPEDSVRELFAQAQIVILPYTASTGSSSVLYQAAMWGRAVISSDLLETRAAVIENDLRVAFFENGKVDSLMSALKTLFDSPNQRRKLEEHNFRVIQRFRPEHACSAYLNAFNLALETHRAPKRIPIPAQTTPESL